MKIEYAINLEDLIEFNLHHVRRLKNSVLTARGTIQFGMTMFAVLVGFELLSGQLHGPGDVLVPALGSVLVALLWRPFTRWCIRSNVKRMNAGGKNKGTLGWHTLEITDSGLLEVSEGGTQEMRFDSVEKIEESDAYAFIYISSMLAHVVPKRAVTQGDLSAFLVELRARVAEHAE